ncbi:MAG: TIM-barrel domain-containing protein [Chitinispirillaceae bacterium]
MNTSHFQTYAPNELHIPSHFKVPFEPSADSRDTVQTGKVRFTVLSSGVIRMEYNENASFEDRPSQAFWFRNQPHVPFSMHVSQTCAEIITDQLHLVCTDTENPFRSDTLKVILLESETIWHYGDRDDGNLGGTVRTLDGVNGSLKLPPGLISRNGWAVVDDSGSLVFDENCWPVVRDDPGTDLYFFGYGKDYKRCIREFCALSGSISLPPRFVFGNWWSRYWAYTQGELQKLVEDFEHHRIPLSVCVVDMDWHIVDNPHHSGWTGYTWNRELFPDPESFFRFLHLKGIRSSLNLHPRDGVHAHEKAYARIAEHMGMNPGSEKPVQFDIADPRFMEGYFRYLHHPLEKSGVDFWWIDWQQGTESSLKGLDPLFGLNHLHYLDSAKDGKRPFVFSRYCGLGGHRYPIGFSGDTHVTWQSLAFQPYFTSTAANVGFCYWSHDIGGHYHGTEDPELYTRWVQFGVFSPVLRIHSANSAFQDRRPFAQDASTFENIRHSMRLRHALVPYIYSCCRQTEKESLPFIRPMYMEHPHDEEAYICGGQYCFGSSLVAAPFTTRIDPRTGLSSKFVWLPLGHWYDFFTGEYMGGDRLFHAYGGLEDIPVYASAGAVVPCAARTSLEADRNPASLDVKVFAGADRKFVLYEDDGVSSEYKCGKCSETTLVQKWKTNRLEFVIGAAKGDLCSLPSRRNWRVEFYGVEERCFITCEVGGNIREVRSVYDESRECLIVTLENISVNETVVIKIRTNSVTLLARRDRTVDKLRTWLFGFRAPTDNKNRIDEMLDSLQNDHGLLREAAYCLTYSQGRVFYETVLRAGFEYSSKENESFFAFWNEKESSLARYFFRSAKKSITERGKVPGRKLIHLDGEKSCSQLRSNEAWTAGFSFEGLTRITFSSEKVQS